MNIKNKVVLITGGARMGEAIGLRLAQRGAHVVYTYHHSQTTIQGIVLKTRSLGCQSVAIRVNLIREKEIIRLLDQIQKSFGALHVLVNLASTYEKKAFKTLRLQDWERNLDTNLKHAYLLAKHAAPLMQKAGGGRIIHFSDWVSRSGRPRYHGFLPYYVAKTGLLGLTEALALELAPDILVNAIAPGPILPPPGLGKKETREVVKNTPLGKWGGAEEIAKTVEFLIETDFVTGECIRVDGGRHLY